MTFYQKKGQREEEGRGIEEANIRNRTEGGRERQQTRRRKGMATEEKDEGHGNRREGGRK